MADVASPDIAALWETGSVDSAQLDLPMPPYPYPSSCRSSSPHHAWSCSPAEKRSPQQQQPQQQIVHVSLHKDPVYEDFGFSVSDGLFERGVYINRLRPGGPCDGLLRPYDRILRVNDASTEDCDCCLAVPLIAAACARLELTVARPLSPSDQVTKLF